MNTHAHPANPNLPRRREAPAVVNWRSTADLKQLAKEFYAQFKKDRVTSLAAAFAYHTVFAIPALLILTITVASLMEQVTSVHVVSQLRDLIAKRAPAETQPILTSILDNAIAKTGGGVASFGLVVTIALALWSGSNAMGALIDSFNRAYDVEETRKFIPLKLRTLGLTLLLALFINGAFVLLVFGQRIGNWIASKAGLGGAFNWAWNISRWPVAIILVGVILAILYYAGPNVDQPFKWVSPGTILATVLWLVATGGFGLYLSVSNPGSAYGALGSILVLLFFLYVTGIVFLLGAELNALLLAKEKAATTPSGKRP